MLDGELAVEALHDLDLHPGVAGPFGPGQQLQRAPAVLHGVVARDRARVPEAEDGGKWERGVEWPVGQTGQRRREPEAGVEARQEGFDHGLRRGMVEAEAWRSSVTSRRRRGELVWPSPLHSGAGLACRPRPSVSRSEVRSDASRTEPDALNSQSN